MAVTTPAPFSSLPPEILLHILNHLAFSDILRFARTSKQHYAASALALQELQLAVLPRRVHGKLAFLHSANVNDPDYASGLEGQDSLARNQVIVTSCLENPVMWQNRHELHPSPARYREELIQLQNALAYSALVSSTLVNLQSLTLHMYDIVSAPLTELLATRFLKLRHLHLNFKHRYIHDTCLPAGYWEHAELLRGSPAWNALAGLGHRHESKLKLHHLESLTLERAGITEAQLRKWIQQNPGLRELQLVNCLGVDSSFVKWLGQYYSDNWDRSPHPTKKLKHLAFEECAYLSLGTAESYSWLDSLLVPGVGVQSTKITDDSSASPLRTLSLSKCPLTSTFALLEYLDQKPPLLDRIGLPSDRVLVRDSASRPSKYPPAESRPDRMTLNTNTVKTAFDTLGPCNSNFPISKYFGESLSRYKELSGYGRESPISAGQIEPDTTL
ncbi:hypothetical protein PV08_07422 [Exophiala spinifera]|uniref:F-box domain-containing protein n=1 Tax=Exophiala spinifera TaxID=91928 RepID=A0A0D2B6V5_9EURO|nr:uncharacterized protein PV08_07422 [Exophiala spinifera]KIW14638.1 hypothetical protein PV08_07422 [Exophiala spinifera]